MNVRALSTHTGKDGHRFGTVRMGMFAFAILITVGIISNSREDSSMVFVVGFSSSSSRSSIGINRCHFNRYPHSRTNKCRSLPNRLNVASVSSSRIHDETEGTQSDKAMTTPTNKRMYPTQKSRTKYNNNLVTKDVGTTYSAKSDNSARNFNARLTGCRTASELLSAFMHQTSSSSSVVHAGDISNNSNTKIVVDTKSVSTHLAGANKVNSVNFSTCLHRLARFASANNNNNNSNKGHASMHHNRDNVIGYENDDDQRRKALSDPRFAILVCSMAEMACGCDANLSIGHGKAVVEKWKENVSHGSMLQKKEDDSPRSTLRREIDVTDDVLHGLIANSHTKWDVDERQTLLTRRRAYAKAAMDQLTASTYSQPSQPINNSFTSRECSNICWALAKLRMAPPGNALPVGRVMLPNNMEPITHKTNIASSTQENDRKLFSSIEEMALDVLDSSLQVRMKLFEEARSRKRAPPDTSTTDKNASIGGGGSWIPELSRLAGKVLDFIAVQIIYEYRHRLLPSSRSDITDQHGGNEGTDTNPGDSDDSRAVSTTTITANSQEMASLLYAFAKAGRGDDTLFSVVANELMRQTSKAEQGREGKHSPKPQELSNTIWAFATAGIRGNAHIELIQFLADALDEGNGLFFGFEFKPQERSNVAWAMASLYSKRSISAEDNSITKDIEDDSIVRNLRWVAKAIIHNADSFKPQELSNSLWAFSTVGFGYDEACGTNSHNDYVHVKSDDTEGDKKLVFEALEVIAKNAYPRLDKFKAQELNNMAWSFARLGHRSQHAETLFCGVAKELIHRTSQFKPQDIGTTLWSMATAEYFDYDAFRAGASRLNIRQIRAFKPQEMSNTVWALATAGFFPTLTRAFDTTLVPSSQRPSQDEIFRDPITECFSAVASETMRRPHDFKDQELKDVLWSFSKAGVRHPALFQKIAKHLIGQHGRGLSSFSSQGLGNTLWAFAKQAQLSLEVIETLGETVKLVSTGRLAVYETSCLDNGENIIKRLFAEAAKAGIGLGLSRYSNQDLSNTVWAYSTLGLLHTVFFKETEKEVVRRLIDKRCKFRGQEIANILWSFATLNAQPGPSMIDALGSYVASECRSRKGIDEASIAKLFGQRQELANLAWSCAVIGRYPKDLMEILYTGLVGNLNDPEQMKCVFNDGGLQKSSIMTLYYVQVAADVEAPSLGLTLPLGFPNGWGEDENNVHVKGSDNDVIQMSSSMLTLTVSKLQKSVSSTFDMIGFENVLEHVIDTNEIKDEYGIQLPHSPKEFLSIDIANPALKIGIEVDGPGHFVRLIDAPDRSPLDLTWHFDDLGDNRVNGPTILKHRLLTHLGWDIIHLPYWEFQELAGDKEKEKAYCQQLLSQTSKWLTRQ